MTIDRTRMCSTPQLKAANIFAIPAGDHFNLAQKSCFLVYSPLAGSTFLASAKEVMALEASLPKYLNQEYLDRDVKATLRALLNFEVDPEKISSVSAPAEYNKLSLIPNYKCNFACSYCYSAAGRSDKELSRDKLKATLDFFIDAGRTKSRELKLFVSGGGEPLASWSVLKYGLDYAYGLANRQKLTLKTQIMTNGSILTNEMIDTFKEYEISVCISFEIIEEIQNLHRGHYDKVISNIARLIKHGIYPSVSSTITKESVTRQAEMFEKMVTQFPQIKGINFDPVLAPQLFDSAKDLKRYFDDFIKYFLIARKRIGQSYHIAPYCSMMRMIESRVIRHCPGKLCITPESTFSVCHSITSPQEKDYEKYIYGQIDAENQLKFDLRKFENLINDNVFEKAECQDCFAKWHCGGGCIMQNSQYEGDLHEASCYFTREFIRQLLLERLEEEYDGSLKEAVLCSVRAETQDG